MKMLPLFILLCCGAAFAQTNVTIPSQTVVTAITVNGNVVNLSITIPSQTITIPAQGGGSTLPTGLTWANGVFTVAGSISATVMNMTSGPALPTSANGLYLWQLVNGVLQPTPYIVPTLTVPPLTVTQSGTNNVIVTP